MIYKEIYFGRKQEKAKVDVTQNSNAQTLVFRSMDWDIPSGSSVNIFVNKPDGHLVYNAGSISGNEMSFAMTTQMTAVPGFAECQVQITTTDDKVLNSFVFDLFIEETIIDGSAVESSDEFTALQGLIADATAAISDCEDATADAIAAAQEARVPVKVGARNLIINTLNPSSTNKTMMKGATNTQNSNMAVAYSPNGVDLSTASSSQIGVHSLAQASTSEMYGVEADEYYILSFDYSGSGAFSQRFKEYYSSAWHTVNEEDLTPEVSVKHFTNAIKVNSSTTGFYIQFELSAGASIRISNLQFEKATVPSQYRPATEDITTPLLAAQSQLNGLIVTETKSITTTSNYYILSKKTGYELVGAYRSIDDSSGYVKAISRRTNGDYTILFDVSSATSLSLFLVWAKVG